jgi:thiol:disulfide interchange protein
MKSLAAWFIAAGLLICTSAVLRAQEAQSATAAKAKPVYSVETYDPKRDAAADLKATMDQARKKGKRILVQVGGDWCGWCHLMNKYFHENETVAAALQKDFIIQKVNYSEENRNKEFLGQYPSIKGYPHLFVLDSDGKLLHSQDTALLEEGKGYRESAVLEFLAKWAPQK